MKRLIISTLLAVLLTALPFNLGFGQDIPDVTKSLFFAGYKHEGTGTPIYGGGGTILGSNFWVFGYTAPSNDTAEAGEPAVSTPLGLEIAYLQPVKPWLRVGLTLSPSTTIDWANIQNAGWKTYITSTSGALAAANFGVAGIDLGLAGWVKYKSQLASGTAFKDRWIWAVVGYYRI